MVDSNKGPLIYGVANQKGGTGKSTTCFCLGAALAEADKKALLVDLDPQAGLTTSMGGEPEKYEQTIYDVLVDQLPLDKVIQETDIENLFLIPSNLDLTGAKVELLEATGWRSSLKKALANGLANSFHYILIDCPPSLGVLTTNALVCAHKVMVPVQLEYLSLRGLKQLNGIITKVKSNHNPDLEIKILRTMHDRRTRHTQEAVEEIGEVFTSKVYKTVINRTIKFADSTLAGEPITSFAPDSEAARAYRNLAQEVIEDG